MRKGWFVVGRVGKNFLQCQTFAYIYHQNIFLLIGIHALMKFNLDFLPNF